MVFTVEKFVTLIFLFNNLIEHWRVQGLQFIIYLRALTRCNTSKMKRYIRKQKVRDTFVTIEKEFDKEETA